MGFYRVLLVLMEFYWVLPVLLGFTVFFWVLPVFTVFDRDLLRL